MKFDCGESWLVKKARLERWHPWFAWFPVRIGNHDCRWWETIERKGEYSDTCGWEWEFRAN